MLAESILKHVATAANLRDKAHLRGSCQKFCKVIDNLLTLDLLAASLKDLCPAGDVEDCGQEPWNPTRRSVMSGIFDAEEDLVEWLGELLPIQGLLRFEAQTLSRLLTFKITHQADDVGTCNLTVEEMPVMTSPAEVDQFWNQVRSDAPADRRPELRGTQWLMRILVKHFDFIFLRARMSCEVYREGTVAGMEFAQIFYQQKGR